jgi:hypothetical protein
MLEYVAIGPRFSNIVLQVRFGLHSAGKCLDMVCCCQANVVLFEPIVSC